MSTIKLITVSITVRARISAARAAFIDPLTASAICSFVATAMYRGMLAVEDAARWAAWHAESRSSFAFVTAVWAESEEMERRKTMKRSERMGYASQARESRWGSSRYGFSVVPGRRPWS